MKPLDRRIAAKSGLRSVPAKRIAAKLAGDPAHINPKEDRLLQRLLPGSHGRVLTSGALAKAGRLGDDRVTLVNPREAQLLKRRGGSGTRNPATGLREYVDGMGGSDNPGGGHNGDQGPGGTGGRSVHAAGSVMAGLNPTLDDRLNDFVGDRAPGGFLGSPAANLGATIAGGLVGGPWGAAAANVAHGVALGGRSLADLAPSAVGGALAGGLGSMAAQAIADGIQGKESYEPTMSLADIDDKATAGVGSARNGTTGTPGSPGDPNPGMNDGAGAGTAYVMAPPAAVVAPTAVGATTAPAPRDVWDEAGFLARNPEVGKAVENGTWTSGRSFNTAYKAQAGTNYDSAKALGLISPYRDDMLAARPGAAVPYRG
jgi:hypothetical protein